jgi:hypothetical protein
VYNNVTFYGSCMCLSIHGYTCGRLLFLSISCTIYLERDCMLL